jgi:hypothetical protein
VTADVLRNALGGNFDRTLSTTGPGTRIQALNTDGVGHAIYSEVSPGATGAAVAVVGLHASSGTGHGGAFIKDTTSTGSGQSLVAVHRSPVSAPNVNFVVDASSGAANNLEAFKLNPGVNGNVIQAFVSGVSDVMAAAGDYTRAVYGVNLATGVAGSDSVGASFDASGVGSQRNTGVQGVANGSTTQNFGVWGVVGGFAPTQFAGYFDGNVFAPSTNIASKHWTQWTHSAWLRRRGMYRMSEIR